MSKQPNVELIAVERGIYGGWKVTVLINNDYYKSLHYHGYGKSQAVTMAMTDAMEEASEIFYNLD